MSGINDSPYLTPAHAYKIFIDKLVYKTTSVSAASIEKDGIYSQGQGDFGSRMNEFVRQLSPEQKSSLAAMLTSERQSAIGDVLSELTWWINCRGLALSIRGESIPVDLSGAGLEGDYVGRLNGWEWPDD